MDEFKYLKVEQLQHDPDNPRQFYVESELDELAQSIAAGGGVEQALLVYPNGDDGYFVVDGNYRLAAARRLDDPPKLKCEVRQNLERREKLLIMARTSEHFYPKDPVSEAKHFERLLESGLTRGALARELGRSSVLIASRLLLLELDDEIQELVARGKLAKDPRATEALLAIPDREARIKLARYAGSRRMTVKGIVKASERLVESLGKKDQADQAAELRANGVPQAEALVRIKGGSIGDDSDWPTIRQTAKASCDACEIKQENLADVAEPAWALISHSAGDTCDACGLASIRGACEGCPLPEFLMRLGKNTAAEGSKPEMMHAA